MVAVRGLLPVLTAVNELILPVPLDASPIELVVFVQLYTVPVTDPENVIAMVLLPLHKVWFETEFTVGIGFTVTVVAAEVSEQPDVLVTMTR